MKARKSRSIVLGMLVFWLALVVFSVYLLFAEQVAHQRGMFLDEVHAIVADIRIKLNSNEVVLAGFSAFLQALNPGDSALATRFASTVTQAHSHIYMIEVARKVPVHEREALESVFRQTWRPDFSIKNFAAGRPDAVTAAPAQAEVWPVVFMYPASPGVDAIYGVDLQTVGHVSAALEAACASTRPVASSVFNLREGGRAYMLLQHVRTPRNPLASPGGPSFFGDTMMAMLLIKADALFPVAIRAQHAADLNYRADLLESDGESISTLFEHHDHAGWTPDQVFLPHFELTEYISNGSQPVVMHFSRQLHWSQLLGWGNLAILMLFVLTLVLVPWLTTLHLHALAIAERQQERATYLATHDMLTTLPNRIVLADRFHQIYQNWRRNAAPFALALIDLDGFKGINDQHGHDIGDEVLKTVALRFGNALRSIDTITRYGGDEFIALLGNVSGADEGRLIGQKLLAAAAQPIQTAAGTMHINCSIGIALCPMHGQSLDALRNAADQAMYQAKQHGGHDVCVLPPLVADDFPLDS